MELTPGAGQSIDDLAGPMKNQVVTDEYYAPEAWTDETGGVYTLKSGYLTPDGVYLHSIGQNVTKAPNPAQLDPIDLTSWVPIRPYANRMGPVDFGASPLLAWNDASDPGAGVYPSPGFVPTIWVNTSGPSLTDRNSGKTFRYMLDGYLTPGIMWLIDQNQVSAIEPPIPTSAGRSYTLPETVGAEWTVDGEPAAAGTHEVPESDEVVTVTVLPVPAPGYEFDPPAQPTVFTFDPPTDDGEDEGTTMMLAALKRPVSNDARAAVAVHYHMVRLFVMEYTRSRGFNDEGKPAPALLAVIVAGAIRLSVNPEQSVMYSLDGVTIRPAIFQGYTLAEQGVLHRYRRRSA